MKIPFLDKISNQNIPEILVFSQDIASLDRIYEILSLKGFTQIKKIHKDPLDIDSNDVQARLLGVVIDAGSIGNTKEYIQICSRIFGKNIPIVILAKNDSIKICQEFLEAGIIFLNSDTQMSQIYAKIMEFEENNENRKSIKISILGTKGGVGNSFVSYQIARFIYERFLTDVICIQGADSSYNLDLLSGKNFERECFCDKDVSLFVEPKDEPCNFHHPKHAKYNFIIYDHSIQSWQKENIELALNESDTAVLVIGYELDSLRKAKEVLRLNEFLLGVNQGAKKLFVCLNTNAAKIKTSFGKGDLEGILQAPISGVIPYLDIDKATPSVLPGVKTRKAFSEFLDLLVGCSLKRKKKWF
ncbi:hypothetical protein [Helicobacter sp. 11S02596-1]|uniref:hypothetical protein n=1 Tax=Helicobacter sp. 11S02596-1 TaxID=1476194 RepID=UPI000BA787EF|nr:hypothetical protein [Helicobacter sp. 11S02596-1]PAF43635.1 hypothetical protein BJI48_05105 [Helicobacter sp. 11S02596-1]